MANELGLALAAITASRESMVEAAAWDYAEDAARGFVGVYVYRDPDLIGDWPNLARLEADVRAAPGHAT